jgi:RNA polymerase sigma-70 factor (ECF subfamily)
MTGTTGHTAALLARLRAGNRAVLNELVAHTYDRLRRRAHRMLRDFPGVGRWEQTDDVLQGALIRLSKALDAEPPESARHFYNLAALQIWRELLDLTDRYQGPLGVGANHRTDPIGGALGGAAGRADEPSSLAEWGEFHRAVERLPDEYREVFGLRWYNGLTHEEVAGVLGVSVKTAKRRYMMAKLLLQRTWGGGPPGCRQ